MSVLQLGREALRELDSFGLPGCCFEPSGALVEANEHLRALLAPLAIAQGENVFHLFDDFSVVEDLGAPLPHGAARRSVQRFESRLERASGARWFTWRVRELEGGALFAATVDEVTERSASRQAARHARAIRNEFFDHAAHEFRTPLAGIAGLAELLGATELSPTQREYVDLLERSALSLRLVFDDVLELSRLGAGAVSIESSPLDLREIAEDAAVAASATRASRARGTEVHLSIDARLPSRLIGDAPRLRRVLDSMLGHAIEASEGGEIELRLALRHSDGAEALIDVEVVEGRGGESTGRDDSIFEPFAAQGRAREGFAGLALCRALVTRLGGVIEASRPGALFGALLPFPIAEERGAPVARALEGERVLIFSTNEGTRSSLEREARSLSGETSSAIDLEGLRALCEAYPVSPCMIDVDATDASGLLAARPSWLGGRRVALVAPAGARRAWSWAAPEGAILERPVRRASLLRALLPAAVPTLVLSQEAEPGTGTLGEETVPMQGPVSEGSDPAITWGASTMLVDAPSARGARVLVIEDDPVQRAVASRVLEALGARVTLAADGPEGADAFAALVYDLVIVDCQLPGFDGFEATRRMRAFERATRRTPAPIVTVSAFVAENARERSRRAGADAHLVKPLSRRTLAAILERAAPPPPHEERARFGGLRQMLQEPDGAAFALEIVETFESSGARYLDALSALSTDEEGRERARVIFHSMRGAASSLGANEFAERCAAFERAAHSMTDPRLAREALEVEFEGAARSMRAFLTEQGVTP